MGGKKESDNSKIKINAYIFTFFIYEVFIENVLL